MAERRCVSGHRRSPRRNTGQYPVETCADIIQQVVGILDAHGKAQQAIADAGASARFRCHGGMSHAGRMTDQAFHATQGFGQGEVFESLDERPGTSFAVLHLETQHGAKSCLLAFGQGMARM